MSVIAKVHGPGIADGTFFKGGSRQAIIAMVQSIGGTVSWVERMPTDAKHRRYHDKGRVSEYHSESAQNAVHVRSHRERQRDAGLREVRVWVPEGSEAVIRLQAKKLRKAATQREMNDE